jgi:hypothetical protein
MPWLDTGSDKIKDEANRMIHQATAGLSWDWKIPITRGHVILLQGGAYGTDTFFKVDGFITYDHPHPLARVEYTARAEQTLHGPLWKKEKKTSLLESLLTQYRRRARKKAVSGLAASP